MPLIRAAPDTDHGVHRRTQSLHSVECPAGLQLHASFHSTMSAPAVVTGLCQVKKGDHVQVFSRTANRWIPGEVEAANLPGDSIVVAFAMGGEDCRKTLQCWSPDVRLPRRSLGSSTFVASETSMSDVTSSASASPADVRSPPRTLYVSAPKYAKCCGMYNLDETVEYEADHPVWVFHGKGGPRWMYLGNDGAWHIGDTDEKQSDFQCCTGFIHSKSVGKGELPDQIPKDAWHSDRKGVWYLDPTIRVTSLDTLDESITQALEGANDKEVLQVVQKGLAAGIPVAAMDAIFPMSIYVACTHWPCASGKFDLVTEEDPHRGLHWMRSSTEPQYAQGEILARNPVDAVGGLTRWASYTRSDFIQGNGRTGMASQSALALPDTAEVTFSAKAQQWMEWGGDAWKANLGTVTSKMCARAHLKAAIDNGGFESLRAALIVGEIAQLPEQELSAGRQGMDKAFQKDKELTISKMASRGVSLRQMLEFYRSQVKTHLGEPNATTHDVVIQMVTQYTKHKRVSLAEQLNGMGAKQCPKHHVVHSWSMKHVDVLKGLVYFVTKYQSKSLDIDEIVYALSQAGIDTKVLEERFFFCGYCVNQHISCDEVTETYLQPDHPCCETNVFEEVAQRIHDSGGNMIVTLDEDFQLLKRIWCLDEIHEALERGMQLDFTTSKLAKLEEKHFADVRHCSARIPADKERILEKIEGGIGFDEFNLKVKQAIKERVAHMRHQATMDPLRGHDGPLARISRLETEHQELKCEHQALKIDHETLKQDFASLQQNHEGLLSCMARLKSALSNE